MFLFINATACERTKVEARVRVELTMVDLQTTALPFGYRAKCAVGLLSIVAAAPASNHTAYERTSGFPPFDATTLPHAFHMSKHFLLFFLTFSV